MKILLIRASNDFHSSSFPHPLGLMYISAYLKKHTDHDVRIRDQHIEACSIRELLDDIADWRPDIVGIGAMTAEARVLYALADSIKKRWPEITVISGGSHASAFTLESLTDSAIDYVVKGEGEETFHALVECIAAGESADGVPGSAYRDGDGVPTLAEERTYVADLDAMPWPDWDGIDLPMYYGRAGMDLMSARERQMSIFTSRACPFECIYCHNTFGKVFRARSPENVLAEIRTLYHDYGVREFLVLDDIFNIDPVRAKKIARMLVDEGMDISLVFTTGFKADLMDDELIELLCEAGMERVAYAVETASPRLQRMIKKNLDLDKVASVIKKTARKGVLTRGYFMIGFPTETPAEIEQTIAWARRSDLHIASFMRVQPFQGTEVRAMAEGMGLDLDVPYEHYNFDYSDVNLSPIPTDEIVRLQNHAYKTFFGSPKRIFRLVMAIPDKRRLPYFFWLWVMKLFAPSASIRRPSSVVAAPKPSLEPTTGPRRAARPLARR